MTDARTPDGKEEFRSWLVRQIEACARLSVNDNTKKSREYHGSMRILLQGLLAEYDRRSSAERARSAEQAELHRMQMAAIMSAALSNTRATATENAIPREHPYWTASYHDVLAAVAREMTQRERAEAAEQQLAQKDAELTDAERRCAALATQAQQLENDREYNARLVEQRDAEIAALRALTTWQPIETAPKDGTVVAVWRDDAGVFTAAYRTVESEDGEDASCWFSENGFEDLSSDLPPLWQPLPLSPAVLPSEDQER